MGRLLAQLTVFTALTSLATAGIQITKPKAGDKFKAGQSLQVEWKEGGSGPAIADLDTFEVFLCAGPNDPKDTNTIVRRLWSITHGDVADAHITELGSRKLTAVLGCGAVDTRCSRCGHRRKYTGKCLVCIWMLNHASAAY